MPHQWLRDSTAPLFEDRDEAGARLLERLRARDTTVDLVLALPRGGLPVAAPIAEGLGCPLDVLVARKVGDPSQPELAIGAVTRLGAVWNDELLAAERLSVEQVETARRAATEEVEQRERAFRAVRPPEPVAGRRVLLVDDGLATGATMAAAVRAVQQAGAATVTVAVPVGSVQAGARLRALAVDVVAVALPEPFGAVGAFYVDFQPVSDERCLEILRRAGARGYEVLEHTADAGIAAHGATLAETFVAAAEGMYALMVSREAVREREERRLELSAPDREHLLEAWLLELLFLSETEHLVFRRFEVSLAEETALSARVCGERIDPERHDPGTVIKAVTRHLLSVEQTATGYRARVLFDV